MSAEPTANMNGHQPPVLSEAERNEIMDDLKKTEDEIETLRQVLQARMRHANTLKQKLGLTPWHEIQNDIYTGWRTCAIVNPCTKRRMCSSRPAPSSRRNCPICVTVTRSSRSNRVSARRSAMSSPAWPRPCLCTAVCTATPPTVWRRARRRRRRQAIIMRRRTDHPLSCLVKVNLWKSAQFYPPSRTP